MHEIAGCPLSVDLRKEYSPAGMGSVIGGQYNTPCYVEPASASLRLILVHRRAFPSDGKLVSASCARATHRVRDAKTG